MSDLGWLLMRFHKTLTVAATLLASLTALALPDNADASASATSPGCTPTYLEGSGLVCPHPSGLYEFFAADGRRLGLTHGPDPLLKDEGAPCTIAGVTVNANVNGMSPPCPQTTPPPERVPYCVDGAATDFYTKVIYARSFDDVYDAGHQLDPYLNPTAAVRQEIPINEFSYTDDEIRAFVHQMNWVVYNAGMRKSIQSDMIVECAQGQVKVNRVVLWQPRDLVDFSAVTAELAAMGWNQPNVKYLIYFDHVQPDCGCGGQGGLMPDDRLVANNMNNGQVPQYAVSWDAPGWFTLLHEWGHTMGAVQNSSPHSTRAGHCWDKLDVMCYNDGGPAAGNYSLPAIQCATMQWDCLEDDYFSTNPLAGSYLTNHWNIGNTINRFVAFRASNMQYLECAGDAAVAGVPYACRFAGGNPGAATVSYRVDWGDGTTSAATGATGAEIRLTHSYAANAAGVRRIHVTATDATAPNPSGGMPWDVTVHDLTGQANACVAGTDDCPVDVEIWG